MPSPDDDLPLDPDVERAPAAGRVRADALAAVAVGGMVGASARYGIARWLLAVPGELPWATFWTNLGGSFVLGAVMVVLLRRFPHATTARRARVGSVPAVPALRSPLTSEQLSHFLELVLEVHHQRRELHVGQL